MPEGRWVIDGGRVAFEMTGRALLRPSAMDVYKAAFKDVEEFQGLRCGPIREQLHSLSFSRVPAMPAVRISASGGKIIGELGVLVGGSFVDVDTTQDQVVHESEWYPIDVAELDSTHLLASEAGVLGADVRLGSLIRLRTTRDPGFTVIDHAMNDGLGLIKDSVRETVVPGLVADLYPYQVQGVHFLRVIAEEGLGCILADEMGLGKTLQVIALLQAEKNRGGRSSLVVAPATLLENWRRELSTFAPELRVYVHAGGGRAGIASILAEADIVVTSYDTAVRDQPMLSEIDWHVMVLDEAQAIKNPEAQRTQAVKSLPRAISIAVSGTPLENRLDDLWSVIDFCIPGALGDLEGFRREFSDDLADAARLSSVVGPLILRRLVADVATDLPEKIEILQPVCIGQRMAIEYENTRQRVLAEHGAAGALVATTYLRSFCAHPSLTMHWDPDPASEMSKYCRLIEILEEIEASREKVLIFSTFQGMADIFMVDLPRRFDGGFFEKIDGRTRIELRQPIVDGFFAHDGFGVLLLNPKAAGTGLNITAANHVIHYNPEWNPALTAQATARSFRRKQQRPVTVHHLFFPDTVEQVIVERADFKRQLAANAVEGHGGDIPMADLAAALQMSPISSGVMT